MHGLRFSWSRTPFQAAIVLALAGVSLAGLPAQAHGQAAGATAAVPAKVLPGDDFYDYVNGDWLRGTQIPADRSSWGSFAILANATNERIIGLVEGLAAAPQAEASARQVSDFYRSWMDEAAIEAKGWGPIKPLLSKINGIRDQAGLARALGESLRADVDPLNATNFYTENLFGLWVAQDLNDTTRNVAYLLQGGLGLPDRAFYQGDSARMQGLRTAYQAHIAAMLRQAGYGDAAGRAARVFALEQQIAASHASREDSADVAKGNNAWRAADFASKAPGLDWQAFFQAAGLGQQTDFIVWHPTAMTGSAALVASVPLATWKDFLAFHAINHFSTILPKAAAGQHFAFYGSTLSGTPQQSPRSKRALAATNAALSDAVGKLYVERYFPPESKARVQDMVTNIVAAFSRRIDKLDWMAPQQRVRVW